MLLLGRGHYSIDVLLAYYVTTRWSNHHHFASPLREWQWASIGHFVFLFWTLKVSFKCDPRYEISTIELCGGSLLPSLWQRWVPTRVQGLVVLPPNGGLSFFPCPWNSLISRYVHHFGFFHFVDPGQFWWWRLFTFWERNVPGPLPQRWIDWRQTQWIV